MPTTALYRISSKEVLKVSLTGQSFSDANPTYFSVMNNPTLVDGSSVRDLSGAVPGPMRVLGFAKIALPLTNTIRNALQAEINTWNGAEINDDAAQDAEQATVLLSVNPVWRKAFKAFVKLTIAEDERIRLQWEQFKADIATASSLAVLKTLVATYPTLPVRTLSQAVTAILNQIDQGD